MPKYAKAFTVTASFFILGSLAVGGPSGKATLASVKKPVFKCSSSFSVTEELALNAIAFAAPGYKNQVVNYSLLSGPSGMTIDESTGKLIWTPSHEQAANPYCMYKVSVKAYDASNSAAFAKKDIKVKVIQVNTKPSVSCPSDVSIYAGEKLLLQAAGSDPDVGQKLKYKLSGAPSGASINSTSGLIAWTTKTSNSGPITFNVVATDNGLPKLSASCAVTVTVTTENHTPTLAAIADKSATVGNALSFTASATDPDPGQSLSFSLSGAPSGATINSSSGKFSWIPTSDQAAASKNYSFKVRVTDSGSPALSAERTVNVTLQDSSETHTVSFVGKLGPLDNPLKGWTSMSANTDASLLFTNVSWKEIEPSDGYFDLEKIDQKFSSGTSAGKHIVFRLYLDYPGQPTGIPQWLYDMGLSCISYRSVDSLTGEYVGGWSPDYNNPLFVSRLIRLIGKLGERYNNDPRIAFVQIGIFGQFGEWTTYRVDNSLKYSVATQRAILKAYANAFPDKKLLGRHPGFSHDPTSVTVGSEFNIGYHDDMFPFQTKNVMLPAMSSKSLLQSWKTQPMGGELWPYTKELMLSSAYSDLKIRNNSHYQFSSASQPFTVKYVGTRWRVASGNGFTAQDIEIVSVDADGIATADKPLGAAGSINGRMNYIDEVKSAWASVYDSALDRVKTFRPSFMGMTNNLLPGTSSAAQARADNLARLMGYQYRLTSATLPKDLKVGQDNAIDLHLVNEGVAPFYYKWKVYVALMDGDVVKQKFEVPWDIRNWLPGAIAETCSINPSIAAGTYDLAIKIEDPWYRANKQGIEFANNLRFDTNGWTHLMQVTLK